MGDFTEFKFSPGKYMTIEKPFYQAPSGKNNLEAKLNPGAFEFYMGKYYNYLHSPGDTSLSFEDFVKEYYGEDLDEHKSKGGRVGFANGGDDPLHETEPFPYDPDADQSIEDYRAAGLTVMEIIRQATKAPTPEILRQLEKLIPGSVREFKGKGNDVFFQVDDAVIRKFLEGRTGAVKGGRVE
jgi:hypothetical protein